jgi:predicted helicase
VPYLDIERYYAKLDRLMDRGQSRNEGTIAPAFAALLDTYCEPYRYELTQQISDTTKHGNSIRFDGVIRDAIAGDCGYWEAKDPKDNLDQEIAKKFATGYPDDNILFENSQTAVLFQRSVEVMRVEMADSAALDRCLKQFLSYEKPEVAEFRQAIAAFSADLPRIVKVLQTAIEDQENPPKNIKFVDLRDQFLEICKTSINPQVTQADVHEILIQHILSEDIFLNIFGEVQFHQENNISQQVQGVVASFFKGQLRHEVRDSIEHYYAAIRNRAAAITNHHEKQEFLKLIYENFYQAYNPKAADRLGIVYTPSAIVRFMIESVDHLLSKHFETSLSQPGVKILDPATGTGTFITELIEYLPKRYLEQKYKEDLFCNEVGILPYYIANLNIEYTYQQKMGKFVEFKNICFVDTLDHTAYQFKQGDLFATSVENTERLKRQNDEQITVIIGNPPYNAWQENFNLRNPNRPYAGIDKRVKDTYIRAGQAQNQIAVYDMFVRFYRWACDRLTSQGMIAFITNRSFIDSNAFDGFRKLIAEEFDRVYIVDTQSDVRKNPKISGTKNNVFGIQTGVAIMFLLKGVR